VANEERVKPSAADYQRYYKQTRGYAAKLLGSDAAHHADDVAQDVWIMLLTKENFPALGHEPTPHGPRLRFIFEAVRYAVMNLGARERTERKKSALLGAGEVIVSGGEVRRENRCIHCRRPTGGRAQLCEAHYYRVRRHGHAGAKGVLQHTRVTDDQVRAIRERLASGRRGEAAAISREFGIGAAQVSRIKHGSRRASVK
jgi:hypothetical protein